MSLLVAIVAALLVHDIHVSNARMAIGPASATMQVRVFRDDLEAAMAKHTHVQRFVMKALPETDSVFLRYFNTRFSIRNGRDTWRAELIGRGAEKGIRPELDIWYYDVKLVGRTSAAWVEIRNELLFDLFRDQTNIVKLKLPRRSERTIMFVRGDGRYTLKL